MERLLVIGLDAAEISLVDRWASDGALPHIRRLADVGARAPLASTAEALSGSVWPTITSGMLPGKHGMYYPVHPVPGHQGVRSRMTQLFPEAFWAGLAASGKRCVTMDVPFCRPTSGGVHVVDWGSYDKAGAPCSVPDRVLTDLVGRFGRHPLARPFRVPRWERDRRELLDQLLLGVSIKAAAARYLLRSEAWDFALVVFGETHAAGHFLSCSTDLDGRGDQPARAAAPSRLQRIYMSVDEAIGAIVSSVPPDTTVAIVSGHGIGPNPHGAHLLPAVLARSGFLATPGDRDGGGQRWLRGDWLSQVRHVIPRHARELVSRRLPLGTRLSLTSRWASADIDWSATRVFSLPGDLQGYLRVNLKGREPEGIVEPGREYEALCAEVAGVMNDLRDPASGERVVARTLRTDHAFPGPFRHSLPDLIVTWAPGAMVDAVESPRVGRLSGVSPDPRPGNHRPTGFLIVAGPRTPSGVELAGGHVCDIAPTVRAFFGLAPSPHGDGKVLAAITHGQQRETVAGQAR